MIPKDDFPDVTYLIEAYFFQNWDEVYGSDESDVLKDLVTTEERARIVAIRDDLTRLLARRFTREELREYAADLGAGSIDEDIARFLKEVRDALERHLAASS